MWRQWSHISYQHSDGNGGKRLKLRSRIFVRIQKTQYAQSVLDTTMTELRTITKEATGYVKLYERTTAMDEQYGGSKGTNTKGNAIEFMTPEGFVEFSVCQWLFRDRDPYR